MRPTVAGAHLGRLTLFELRCRPRRGSKAVGKKRTATATSIMRILSASGAISKFSINREAEMATSPSRASLPRWW